MSHEFLDTRSCVMETNTPVFCTNVNKTSYQY